MIRFYLILLSFCFVSIFAPTHAQAQEFNEAQKAEIRKMFDEFLAESGERILGSVNSYQVKIEEENQREANEKAQSFVKSLDSRKDLPMTGNKDGSITMVEFFDYNCGYCRKALEEIQTVLKDDKDLRVIFMDMPILGPASLEASKWSLAANKQGKYFEFHQALLEHNGQKNEEVFESIAKDLGLDVKQLKKDKDNKDIAETLTQQTNSAQEIGIRGTPGFILAGEIFPGYMPASQIKEIIAKARDK